MVDEVLDYIIRVREEKSYCKGNCWWFFSILRRRFGVSVIPYYDSNHILSKYKDKFYDKNGIYQKSTKHFIRLTNKPCIDKLCRAAKKEGYVHI